MRDRNILIERMAQAIEDNLYVFIEEALEAAEAAFDALRKNLDQEAAVDAILGYWLSGTDNPDLAEWWTTADAPEVATELVNVVLVAALGEDTDA